MTNKRKSTVLSIVMLIALIAMLFVPFHPTSAQSSEPQNVAIKLWLFAKSNGETEVNHYIHWTETSPRDHIDFICDCKADDLAFQELFKNNDYDRPIQMTATDISDVSSVFHTIRLSFSQMTEPGMEYQAEVGYGSYQDTWYAGYDEKGRAIFEWTYNPWPFTVTYDVHLITQSMPPSAADNDGLSVPEGYWSTVEKETPDDYYKSKGFGLHMTRDASANEPLVVRVSLPGQYFSKNTYSPVEPAAPTSNPIVNQPPSNNQPEQPPTSTNDPQEGSPLGGFLVVVFILVVVTGAVLLWAYYAGWFNKKPKREDEESYYPEPSTGYTRPTLRRESKTEPLPSGVASDLTFAQAAVLMGGSDYKIVLAAVHDLKKRGLVTVISDDPLKLAKRPRKVAAADAAGELTSVDNAVLTAVFDDGQINAIEQDMIVAAVRASMQMKMATNDETATRDYYEERIRALEQKVRKQSDPTVYVERNNDIWFWLWLSERYDHDTPSTPGSYRYPTPQHSVYIPKDGARQPVNNDTFKQSAADFSTPKPGITEEISSAASRAAGIITGSAAGGHDKATPVPKPHSACYVHSKASHDNCHTRHSNCHTHDNCHTHSNCHSHSNCHTRHSNCHTGGSGRPR